MELENQGQKIHVNRRKKLSFKDLDIKILIQKIIAIVVIQFAIYGIFIIIDPGFYDSLQIYFIFVVIGSSVLVGWVHIHNTLKDVRTQDTDTQPENKVLEQTDWTPEKRN